MAGDGEDDADGKSSLAPMISPRSATPAAAPQTAASATERVQSSIGVCVPTLYVLVYLVCH